MLLVALTYPNLAGAVNSHLMLTSHRLHMHVIRPHNDSATTCSIHSMRICLMPSLPPPLYNTYSFVVYPCTMYILDKRKLKFSNHKINVKFASYITYWQAVAMKCATSVSACMHVDGSHFAGSTTVPFLYINHVEEFEGFAATTGNYLQAF